MKTKLLKKVRKRFKIFLVTEGKFKGEDIRSIGAVRFGFPFYYMEDMSNPWNSTCAESRNACISKIQKVVRNEYPKKIQIKQQEIKF